MLTRAALAQAVEAELRARRLRDELFGPDLSETAWLILLNLFAASLGGHRLCVMELCIASRAPSTTALRTLAKLVDAGRVERSPDGADARRSHVAIAPEAAILMRRYWRLLDDDERGDVEPGERRRSHAGSIVSKGLTSS